MEAQDCEGKKDPSSCFGLQWGCGSLTHLKKNYRRTRGVMMRLLKIKQQTSLCGADRGRNKTGLVIEERVKREEERE